MATLTDEQLALGVQAGKEQDIVTLFERHYSGLVGYLYRLYGGSRALAEDTAQDVLLQATLSIQHYQYPRPFKTWLYTIATDLARNHYRRADTKHAVMINESELEQIPAADDLIARQDDKRYVGQLLAALPDHQREVILLRYYEDFSLQEIALTLHIPTGTVKSRLSLGLKQLRAITEVEKL